MSLRFRKLFRGKQRSLEIPCPGGVIAPGMLGEIARSAHQCGVEELRIGARQSLWIDFPDAVRARSFVETPVGRELSRVMGAPNLMSSVAAVGVLDTAPWLSESVFFDIFDAFALRRAERRVRLLDSPGTLLPLSVQDVNFTASPIRHHWFLHWDAHTPAPFLVPSFLLAEVAAGRSVETIATEHSDSLLPLSEAPSAEAFTAEPGKFEGFHEMNGGRFRLGIARESLRYPVLFLDELAYLARKHNLGRIYFTACHALMLKGISPENLPEWRRFVARHGVNLRHNSASLVWRLIEDQYTLDNVRRFETLRRRLLRLLRQQDAAVEGLSFSICTSLDAADTIVAVVVHRSGLFGRPRYSLYQRRDFHPGSGWIAEAAHCGVRELGRRFARLCERYRNHFSLEPPAVVEERGASQGNRAPANLPDAGAFQCVRCWNVYDPRYGDDLSDVAPGIAFGELGEDYRCPVCNAPANAFQPWKPTEALV